MQEKILLVEDSLFVCKTVCKRLEQHLNLSVVVAHSLDEAMAVVENREEHFFVALLDLNLPDAPNGEIVDYISMQGIPFVVFTGSESAAMRQMCETHKPMIDYVKKDSVYSIDYLGTLINRLQKNRDIEALVVDDSAVGRKRVVDMLRRSMLKTCEAASAEEALEFFVQPNSVRLVMVDYNLPGMNGFELCKTLRDRPENRDLIIIGFSGESDKSLAARYLKSGANDYIPKSCSPEELLCRLMQNLNMQDYVETYREASNRDFLTGLYNRRFLLSSVPLIQASARRNKKPYVVTMLDIDHFKRVNDVFGHDAGDIVLKSIAGELKQLLRESDLLARIGGEEFCVVAENCTPEAATLLFEKLRRHIEAHAMMSVEGEPISITVSMGICCDMTQDFESMLRIADENLYQAKESGRNQIVAT